MHIQKPEKWSDVLLTNLDTKYFSRSIKIIIIVVKEIVDLVSTFTYLPLNVLSSLVFRPVAVSPVWNDGFEINNAVGKEIQLDLKNLVIFDDKQEFIIICITYDISYYTCWISLNVTFAFFFVWCV